MQQVVDFLMDSRTAAILSIGLSIFGIWLTWALRPKQPIKTLHWAHLGKTEREGIDAGHTNIAVWNPGPTLRGTDFPPLRPLHVSADAGADLRSVRLVAKNNPANGVTIRRPIQRKRAGIAFAYLEKGDGFVLRVSHTGPSSVLRLDGAIIGGRSPKWAGGALIMSFGYLLGFHLGGRRAALQKLWMQRTGIVLTVACTATAPYVFWSYFGDFAWVLAISYIVPTLLLLRILVVQWSTGIPRGLEAVLEITPTASKGHT
jgi:hypothetical protein